MLEGCTVHVSVKYAVQSAAYLTLTWCINYYICDIPVLFPDVEAFMWGDLWRCREWFALPGMFRVAGNVSRYRKCFVLPMMFQVARNISRYWECLVLPGMIFLTRIYFCFRDLFPFPRFISVSKIHFRFRNSFPSQWFVSVSVIRFLFRASLLFPWFISVSLIQLPGFIHGIPRIVSMESRRNHAWLAFNRTLLSKKKLL